MPEAIEKPATEKVEKYDILEQWKDSDSGKSYRRVRTRGVPVRGHEEHEFELIEESIPPHYEGGPTGWFKVNEKDLGPVANNEH